MLTGLFDVSKITEHYSINAEHLEFLDFIRQIQTRNWKCFCRVVELCCEDSLACYSEGEKENVFPSRSLSNSVKTARRGRFSWKANFTWNVKLRSQHFLRAFISLIHSFCDTLIEFNWTILVTRTKILMIQLNSSMPAAELIRFPAEANCNEIIHFVVVRASGWSIMYDTVNLCWIESLIIKDLLASHARVLTSFWSLQFSLIERLSGCGFTFNNKAADDSTKVYDRQMRFRNLECFSKMSEVKRMFWD